MKQSNYSGIFVFIVNLVICMFLYTSEGLPLAYSIAAVVSSIIALVINIYVTFRTAKKVMNGLFIIVNLGVLIYTIYVLVNLFI